MLLSNSSWVSSLVLSMYSDPGRLRWFYVLVLSCMYALTLLWNVLLIAVIVWDRTLHQPMYVLLVSLFMNELYGGTSVFPFLLFQIVQESHEISRAACFLQIFCLYSYGNVTLLTLAAMSYDRFVAICFPLQYHARLSCRKAAKMAAATWLFVLLEVGFMVSLSAPLRLCGRHISKVYCDNYSVVKLACGDTTVNNVYGLLYTCVACVYVPALILYSYVRIIRVCVSGSARTRRKALSTCAPHLAAILNLAFGGFFEILQSRFDMSHVSASTPEFQSEVVVLDQSERLLPLRWGATRIRQSGVSCGCVCVQSSRTPAAVCRPRGSGRVRLAVVVVVFASRAGAEARRQQPFGRVRLAVVMVMFASRAGAEAGCEQPFAGDTDLAERG
ncbi:hypothetical protein WMY93_031815 [Mugilogobius chulae]|uniref:G-protein coupled receptors family 1 profile domain-containing protein n=1 Tax=Mugilogobius chulae TaxID=88201 RepID=A0AAW0MDK9_9GOBI